MLARESYSIYVLVYIRGAVYLNIKAPQLPQLGFSPNIHSKFYISMASTSKAINYYIIKQSKTKNNWIQTLSCDVVKITVQLGTKMFTMHRNLLFNKALWFKKPFLGPFVETERGYIAFKDIEIEDIHTIGTFISWLYEQYPLLYLSSSDKS